MFPDLLPTGTSANIIPTVFSARTPRFFPPHPAHRPTVFDGHLRLPCRIVPPASTDMYRASIGMTDREPDASHQFASYPKINGRTMCRLAADREMPAFEVGRSWRITKAETAERPLRELTA